MTAGSPKRKRTSPSGSSTNKRRRKTGVQRPVIGTVTASVDDVLIKDFIESGANLHGSIEPRMRPGISAINELKIRVGRRVHPIRFGDHWDLRMIDREPNRDGLALHPRQGDVGKEAALVAPAHICMGAAKPTLLNVLARLNERRPERHLIVRPELVDGYGVGGILDDPAQFHIVK